MSDPIRSSENGVKVDLLVVPNASRTSIVGLHGSRVKVRVAGPPEKGKANAAVVQLLKTASGARRVEVTAGRTHRFKTVELWSVDVAEVRQKLTRA